MKDLDPPASPSAPLDSAPGPSDAMDVSDWATGSSTVRFRSPTASAEVLKPDVPAPAACERFALLAHDLKNLLHLVQGNLELAMEFSGDELSASTRASLAAAFAGSERMGVLLGQTLDVFHIETSAGIDRSQVCLETLLADCARLYTPVDLDAAVHVSASGVVASIDANLVERAIANILFNAARYVNVGGRIELSAHVSAAGELIVDVGNTGPAPSAAQDVLFSRFGVGKQGKLGLGLYFCRKVCEAHGGSIALAPQPGLPTNFRLLLPGS